ncbi:hypothetical protein PR048_006292 [Dryococelus australis]|uniref:HTH psq-type domain-containing protein n=1 Tax=Dryococelus australis TaxID=614101 RepID=A0ABQ9IB77_9NEOP|nr:hypothetical protein PR048_006292 [Dryococelus australis]
MPQHRAQTTQKASRNAETLAAAVKSIQEDKKSIRQAARCYGIPYATLHDRLKSGDIPAYHLREPQATNINRITAFNKDEVKHFYDNLEGMMVKYKFSPGKIFNVDDIIHNPAKTLVKKEEKSVRTAVSWERG